MKKSALTAALSLALGVAAFAQDYNQTPSDKVLKELRQEMIVLGGEMCTCMGPVFDLMMRAQSGDASEEELQAKMAELEDKNSECIASIEAKTKAFDSKYEAYRDNEKFKDVGTKALIEGLRKKNCNDIAEMMEAEYNQQKANEGGNDGGDGGMQQPEQD